MPQITYTAQLTQTTLSTQRVETFSLRVSVGDCLMACILFALHNQS